MSKVSRILVPLLLGSVFKFPNGSQQILNNHAFPGNQHACESLPERSLAQTKSRERLGTRVRLFTRKGLNQSAGS